MEQEMAIPRLPRWGKNNDPEQWWNVNDFEILCASYRHKVEGLLKTVSPYFPRGPKSDDDFPELRTPTIVTGWSASVSELPAPRQIKAPRFGGEDSDIPPISTVTGQGRLATLLEDDTINIPPTKEGTEQPNQKEDPFLEKGISNAPKKFISAIPNLDLLVTTLALSLNPNQPNHLFLLDLINDPPLPPLPLILNQSITTLI